jgi:hypothetical protein
MGTYQDPETFPYPNHISKLFQSAENCQSWQDINAWLFAASLPLPGFRFGSLVPPVRSIIDGNSAIISRSWAINYQFKIMRKVVLRRRMHILNEKR